eukprot:SAG22_NODE_317_length_12513_cov_41.467214_11_plen_117_part_00
MLATAGDKLDAHAERALAELQAETGGGPGASFLKIKEAEQKVADGHEVSGRIRQSLASMAAAEVDMEQKAGQRQVRQPVDTCPSFASFFFAAAFPFVFPFLFLAVPLRSESSHWPA